MTEYRRLSLKEVGEVTVARFRDWRIEDSNIQEVEQDLFRLVDTDGCHKLLLNFATVDFLSSAGLGRLLALDQRAKKSGCAVKLCNIRPEIQQILAITKLNRLFDIKDTEADALASFQEST